MVFHADSSLVARINGPLSVGAIQQKEEGEKEWKEEWEEREEGREKEEVECLANCINIVLEF